MENNNIGQVSCNVFNAKSHDIDPYNIVHHAVYLIWMEECWVKHIRNLVNIDLHIDLNDYLVVNLKCKYINSIFLNDVVKIYTVITEIFESNEYVTVSFNQWIKGQSSNKKIATCSSKVSFKTKYKKGIKGA